MPFAAFALAALVSAGAAGQLDQPPVAFLGYNHPDVTADNCKAESPGRTVCYIPPKTMGRYLISAEGRSTATTADAVQVLEIGGPGWACSPVATKKGDWSGGPRTLAAVCLVSVLSDTAVQVNVTLAGKGATPDPEGPVVTFRRVPWSGVLDAAIVKAGVEPPKPAGRRPAP